jgi:hypothetical protein
MLEGSFLLACIFQTFFEKSGKIYTKLVLMVEYGN